MRKTREEEHGTMLTKLTLGICGGIGVSLMVCLGTLGVLALAISSGLLGASEGLRPVLLACFVGSLSGSACAIRHCGARALLVALAVGGGSFLLYLTAGVALFQTGGIDRQGGGILCAALCGSAIAHILFGMRHKKKRRKIAK